jgi:hypothetical protein
MKILSVILIIIIIKKTKQLGGGGDFIDLDGNMAGKKQTNGRGILYHILFFA